MKKNETKAADIFQLIKADHKEVAELFDEILEKKGGPKGRLKLYSELQKNLMKHALAEEAMLYPRLKEHRKSKDMGYEASEEHDLVKHLFSKIDGLDAKEDEWKAAVTVLKEVVEHHVEEEESEMFKLMRAVFDKDELIEMASEFEAAKNSEQDLKVIEGGNTDRPGTRTKRHTSENAAA